MFSQFMRFYLALFAVLPRVIRGFTSRISRSKHCGGPFVKLTYSPCKNDDAQCTFVEVNDFNRDVNERKYRHIWLTQQIQLKMQIVLLRKTSM